MEIREMLVKFNSTKDSEILELVNEYVNDYKEFEEPHTFYQKMRDIVKDISDEIDREINELMLGFVRDFDFFNENDFVFEKEIEVEEEEEEIIITGRRAATNFKLAEKYKVAYDIAEKTPQEMAKKHVLYLVVNENNGRQYYGVCKGENFGKFLGVLLDNYKCLKTGRQYNTPINEQLQNDFNASKGKGFAITALKIGNKENLMNEKKAAIKNFENKELLYNIR